MNRTAILQIKKQTFQSYETNSVDINFLVDSGGSVNIISILAHYKRFQKFVKSV